MRAICLVIKQLEDYPRQEEGEKRSNWKEPGAVKIQARYGMDSPCRYQHRDLGRLLRCWLTTRFQALDDRLCSNKGGLTVLILHMSRFCWADQKYHKSLTELSERPPVSTNRRDVSRKFKGLRLACNSLSSSPRRSIEGVEGLNPTSYTRQSSRPVFVSTSE